MDVAAELASVHLEDAALAEARYVADSLRNTLAAGDQGEEDFPFPLVERERSLLRALLTTFVLLVASILKPLNVAFRQEVALLVRHGMALLREDVDVDGDRAVSAAEVDPSPFVKLKRLGSAGTNDERRDHSWAGAWV